MMSTDATEDDMGLVRTEEADLDPPRVLRYCGDQGVYKGPPFCLIGGAGGGKGCWEGTETSLVVI